MPICIWLFTTLQIHYSKIEKTTNYIEKLDNEITFRVSNYYNYLEQGSLVGFKAQINNNYLYPQFSGINVQGLMLELEKSVTESERSKIILARRALVKNIESDVRLTLAIRGWLVN